MHRIATIELDDDDAAFIKSRINSGQYGSEQALMSEALKLLKQQKELINAALIEGEQSGAPTPFSFDDFLARKMV